VVIARRQRAALRMRLGLRCPRVDRDLALGRVGAAAVDVGQRPFLAVRVGELFIARTIAATRSRSSIDWSRREGCLEQMRPS
jgi:hypothetical protein